MNNSSQNPLQVLKAKTQALWSGCIAIQEPKEPSVNWQVYLLEGKIQYVTTTAEQQARLNYLWQKFNLGSNCPKLEDKQISEYVQICQWLSSKQLTKVTSKNFILSIVTEGLTHILSIEKTNINLIPAKRIKKSIISFDLGQLDLNEQIKAWQEVRTYLHSPFSQLYLSQKNSLNFYKIWKTLYADPALASLAESQKLSSFVSLFVVKSNLYEIALKTNLEIDFLAKYLKQSIEEGILDLLPLKELGSDSATNNSAESNNNTNTSNLALKNVEPNSSQSLPNEDSSSNLVVCIDDSKTVQKQVKMTLNTAGYKVIGILDPSKALKDLFQYQPTVIFLDINMPNINGYDLCSLLRKSKKFKEIPIVMLTGRDGMIDRVRAKLVGATDYLTKPCDPNKLISLTKILGKPVVTSK